MRLQEIIDIIKKIGGSQPNVNSSTEGSIYEVLNTNPSIDYANFHITQNKHTSNNQFITYNFILFYTDRLMDDKSNKLQIQSIGIEVLSNVLRTIQTYYEDAEVLNTDFQPFTERFSDNCAGVFSNVSVIFPIEYTCEEMFVNIISTDSGKCEIRNEYVTVNVTENGQLTVNYGPNYTGLERVVINTNVPQTIITGDTLTGAVVLSEGEVAFKDFTKMKQIGNVVIEGGYSINGIFYGCSSLTSIGGLSWDTSNVTSMATMFNGCSSLTSIGGMSEWDLSRVTNINGMFYGCSSLTSLDEIKNWNTSNVTSMSSLFRDCKKITSLDLSRWDLSNVTDMYWMFGSCTSLTSLNLSNCDMSNVSEVSLMFVGAGKLVNLNLDNAKLPHRPLTNLYFPDALSVESLVSIINALPTTTRSYTLTLGSTNIAKLTPEQISIATNKGWSLE